MREEEFKDSSCAEILKTMCSLAELVYFSARKVSSSRGGRHLHERSRHRQKNGTPRSPV